LPHYSLAVSDSEVRRYLMMAERAQKIEGELRGLAVSYVYGGEGVCCAAVRSTTTTALSRSAT
jgi:hypothetical protein